jgi:hypothetical protein
MTGATGGAALCAAPRQPLRSVHTRNRDVNDPVSGAQRRPRALSGSFTSRFRVPEFMLQMSGGW